MTWRRDCEWKEFIKEVDDEIIGQQRGGRCQKTRQDSESVSLRGSRLLSGANVSRRQHNNHARVL